MNNDVLIEIVTLWKEYTDNVKKHNDKFINLDNTIVDVLERTSLEGFLTFLTTKLEHTPDKGGVVNQLTPKELELQREKEQASIKSVDDILKKHHEDHKDDLS